MYARNLKKLNRMIFKHIQNKNNPHEIIKVLKSVAKSRTYLKESEKIAFKMVTMLKQEDLRSWREAAKESSKGNEIYKSIQKQLKNIGLDDILSKQIKSNAKYIKTMPLYIAEEITEFVESETRKGVRSGELAEYIKTVFPKTTKSRAELIARTETSKAQTALVQTRAQRMGINWYRWKTSKDSRVRSAHDIMDGVLVNWNNPPCPEKLDSEHKGKTYGSYHAGNIFNCRCYAEPVVDIEFISFPCNVYYKGAIMKMNKSEFKRIDNIA